MQTDGGVTKVGIPPPAAITLRDRIIWINPIGKGINFLGKPVKTHRFISPKNSLPLSS
jgi:hypothetical protein